MSTVLDQGNRTFIGSVLFLDIVGYTKKSVAAQIAMKDRFTSLLSASLKDIAPDQRIILDTGDGAAITFLGDPEDALFVAMHLRDALRLPEGENDGDDTVDVPIRTGINLGPVKLVRDINGQPNIVGDGINVAQRIMSFAPTRQIVVSRSFYDMVSVISEEYSKLFTYEGSRTDKHVRDHEIYVVGESAAAFKQAKDGMTDRAAITNSRARALKIEDAALAASVTASMPAQPDPAPAGNKKFVLAGGALAALVVALGVALVMKTSGEKPAQAAAPATATAPSATSPGTTPASEPVAKAPVATQAPAAPAASTAPKTADSAPAKPAAPPAEVPGVLTFGIQPWGEVFINGKSIGVSPPLKQTKLAAGQYTVEVRNTSFPTFTTRVDLKSKETRNIAHKF